MIVAVGVTAAAIAVTFVSVVLADYVSRKVSSTFVLTVALLTHVVRPVSQMMYKVGSFIYWVLRAGLDELLRIAGRALRRLFNFVCAKLDAAIDCILDMCRALRELIRRIVRPLYDALVWVWDVLSYIFDFTTLWASVKSTTALFLYVLYLPVDFWYGLIAYKYRDVVVVRNIVAFPGTFRNWHISTGTKIGLAACAIMMIPSVYILIYVELGGYMI
jgi:hypothetical protein